MRVLPATLLLIALFGAAVAQDCNNALLTSDMIARFGGQANVLTTARTLASTTPVCQMFANKSVCISEAGFTYFASYLEQYRNNFTQRSQSRDQQRYNGVGANLNTQNQTDDRNNLVIQVGGTFNQTIINFNMSGQQPPYDFTNFLNKLSQKGQTRYVAPSENQINKQNDMQMADNNKNGRPPLQGLNNNTPKAQQLQQQQGGQQQGQQGQSQQQGQQGQGSQQGQQQQGQQQQGQQQQGQNGTQQGQQPQGQKRFLQGSNQQQGQSGQQQQGQQQGQSGQSGQSGQQQGQGQGQQNQGPPQNNQGWMSLQNNLGQAKARCGVAVMKQYYFATCLAALASSATNGTVGGTTSSPTVTVSNDACNGYKSKCTDYFTYASQAENTKQNVDNGNSLWAALIYAVVSNSSLSTSEKSTQLNVYATQVLTTLNTAARDPKTKPWAPLSCNSSNTGASDCNYVCTNVITATGFNEDNFNLISTTTSGAVASGRVLASSGSVILSSGSNGINPDGAISDSSSAVVLSVQSVPDTSSARALVASLALIMSFIALF